MNNKNTDSILLVGLTCLDIVNVVDYYPNEDEDIRISEQRRVRGGNASNSSVVLASLCSKNPVNIFWLGTIGDGSNSKHCVNEMIGCGVNTSLAEQCKEVEQPTSYILENKQNGSRTIAHYSKISEVSSHHFKNIWSDSTKNLDGWNQGQSCRWAHFEGRNINATEEMMHEVKLINKSRIGKNKILISVELEKPVRIKDGIKNLAKYADVIFFSSDFAKDILQRRSDIDQESQADFFLKNIHEMIPEVNPRAIIFLPWGSQGAWAFLPNESSKQILFAPAVKLLNVVDTIGAGDTFIAAAISRLYNYVTRPEQSDEYCWPPSSSFVGNVLSFSCKIAGRKCSQRGFLNLVD